MSGPGVPARRRTAGVLARAGRQDGTSWRPCACERCRSAHDSRRAGGTIETRSGLMPRRNNRKDGDRDDDDRRDVIEAIEDVAIYPVLTDSVTLPRPRSGGANAGLPITQTAETEIRQVLGWKYRDGDAKGVMQALSNSFTVTEEEGHTVVTWTPRSYAAVVSADLGEVTGAQASIYARAKVALDQILPLLDGLKGLRPDFDMPQADAMRA